MMGSWRLQMSPEDVCWRSLEAGIFTKYSGAMLNVVDGGKGERRG